MDECNIRTDERIKVLQDKNRQLEEILADISQNKQNILAKLLVIEETTHELHEDMKALEKRIIILESDNNKNRDRWNNIISLIMQIIWVLLAAWLLSKLNLQPPIIS
jgi:septal ring factor EnvC (AmiA/AmiB activator)